MRKKRGHELIHNLACVAGAWKLGSFSNDDGDGNEDVKKSNRFIEQNN